MTSNPLARLGNTGLYLLCDLGKMTLFLGKAVRGVFRRPFRFRELLRQVHFIGFGSLAVIFFTAACKHDILLA